MEDTVTACVSARINEEHLLKNLRHAFSNRYSVVSELMQNARRAGASYVAIEYDTERKCLTVRDDGCGIDDFQKLFTFGESGWNQALVEAETAFGLGFTKSLYSATHCTVISRGRVISFDTADALAKKPIEVRAAATGKETVVVLEGVELEGLDAHVRQFCLGFPINVRFNGVVQERPYALDQLPTIACSIGCVFLRGYRDGEATRGEVVFLQGFHVAGKLAYIDHSNIVHLDAARFHARLPDRDKLIDEDKQLARISADLTAIWRKRLLEKKSQLGAEAFVRQWYEALKTWAVFDLLDDVPFLPGALFSTISDYPHQEGYGEADYLTSLERLITRGEVERGQLSVVELDGVEEENVGRWMVARERGFIVFDDPGLSEHHWIHAHVRALESEAWAIEVEEASARAVLDGSFVCPTVVLCKAYTIVLGEERVRIDHSALYSSDADELIVPDEEASGRGVRQVSDFIDSDDHFHDDDQQNDQDALEALLWRLRETDAARVLGSMLERLGLKHYPSLHGKTFRLKVTAGGQKVELEA